MSLMQFDELVPGATVRFTVVDGVQYLSVRDLIMVVCEKDANHAQEVWRRLPDDKKTEVNAFCVQFKFSGRGQQVQPMITFEGALTLMSWLPGVNAKNWRGKTAKILKRYFAGDPTLLDDIRANSVSQSPLNQFARASDASESDLEQVNKRPRFLEFTEELKEHNLHMEKHMVIFKGQTDLEVDRIHKVNQARSEALLIRREEISLEREAQEQKLKFELAAQEQKLTLRQAEIKLEYEAQQQKLALRQEELKIGKFSVNLTETEGLTVRQIYYKHERHFPGMKSKSIQLVKEAGLIAATTYKTKVGSNPPKSDDGLNVYPSNKEDIVLDALRDAFRKLTCGVGQPSIRGSLTTMKL